MICDELYILKGWEVIRELKDFFNNHTRRITPGRGGDGGSFPLQFGLGSVR